MTVRNYNEAVFMMLLIVSAQRDEHLEPYFDMPDTPMFLAMLEAVARAGYIAPQFDGVGWENSFALTDQGCEYLDTYWASAPVEVLQRIGKL
jgi:hypothetical protein